MTQLRADKVAGNTAALSADKATAQAAFAKTKSDNAADKAANAPLRADVKAAREKLQADKKAAGAGKASS